MKKIAYIVLLIAGICILGACSKDPGLRQTGTTGNETGSSSVSVIYPIVYTLTASNWVTTAGTGVFTSDLGSVPAPGNASVIKIFVVDGNKKIQINNTANFATGEIWAINYGAYIKVVYRDLAGSYTIPFTHLLIRVEIW